MFHKFSLKATAIPVGLMIGALVNMIITLAGSAATAHLVLNERIGENTIGYASMLILLISAAMGAWCSFTCIKRLRLQICLLSGGVYYLLLLAMTALFFGGQYRGMGVSAIIVLIGVLSVALFPTKNRAKWKLRKRAFC